MNAKIKSWFVFGFWSIVLLAVPFAGGYCLFRQGWNPLIFIWVCASFLLLAWKIVSKMADDMYEGKLSEISSCYENPFSGYTMAYPMGVRMEPYLLFLLHFRKGIGTMLFVVFLFSTLFFWTVLEPRETWAESLWISGTISGIVLGLSWTGFAGTLNVLFYARYIASCPLQSSHFPVEVRKP